MNKFAKLAAVAVAALATTPAYAQAVGVTGQPPSASARIIKPLTLTSAGAMNFGTIVIPSAGVAADRTIVLGDTGLITDCGGDVDTVCSGATSVPTYTVTGTNRQQVTVHTNDSTLNGNNGGTLTLSPTHAGTVTLPNSGNLGTSFAVGGEITISSTTVDGLYTGFVDVTVEY
jgi:Domain of unknown function (DUF4402)